MQLMMGGYLQTSTMVVLFNFQMQMASAMSEHMLLMLRVTMLEVMISFVQQMIQEIVI